MRPPKISLVTALSVFLLLSCLLGSAAGFARQQRLSRHRVVRSNRFIEARQLDGEPTDGYGPPPPYYTGEPAVPTEMASYSTSEETTATGIDTGSSEASMASAPHASSGNYTVSRGIPSLSMSSRLDTNTAVPSAASSAKAGSTTSSEALTTVGATASGSSRVTGSSSDGISATTDGHVSTAWNNSTSPISTGSSAVTNRASDSTSMIRTASLETELSSTGASSVTISSLLTGTETTTEGISGTDTASSLEASGTASATFGTSSNVEGDSLSKVLSSTPLRESSRVTALTTTTTKVFNTTVTVTDVVESTGLTLSSTTYLTLINGTSSAGTSAGFVSDVSSRSLSISSEQTTTSMPISGQDSSQTSTLSLTAVTISEENPTSASAASGSVVTSATQDGVTEISVSESAQRTSLVASRFLNGTLIVTTTTYVTSTLGTSALSTGVSSQADGSSDVTSDGLSGAGTQEPSQTAVSMTPTSFSNVTNEGSTTITLTSSAIESSVFFTSTATLNGRPWGSESDITTVSIRSSPDPLVASSALPVNATSNAVTSSFTTTTMSESSVITIVPGGISPTGKFTGMTSGSVSADYSTSATSPFNSSMTHAEISSSQEASSFLDWSTSTVAESQPSEATLGLPPISFTSLSFSIITTPMTPPSVTTGSTSPPSENVTVIRSTWTSTITTSLGPTGLTSSARLTAAHSSSGYNFSTTLESEMSSVGSWHTSANNLTDISTSIITRQPTNWPLPTNTTSGWKPTASSVSLTESAKTMNSQGAQTSLSTPGSGLNTTAPYANSISATGSATYSPTLGDVTSSKVAATTYRSWNTTNTAQGPANSTIRTATSYTQTEASMSGATKSLNGTVTVTSPFPSTEHITLTTISGSIMTKTYTDILVSIITPTDPIFWSSSTISLSLNSTPPFPFPSNTTVAGTGVPLSPTGTGINPTIISSSGDVSTPYKTSTSTSERKYYTSNSTQSVTGSSGSASGTNAPLFPSFNSTATAAITFSSIASWTPDPEPWTTWSTWDLTGKSGASVSNRLPRVTTGNLSSETSVSTSYTRTTTLFLTTTLAEPSTSQSKFHNSTGDAPSSVSYTSTTTLFLTTTLGEPSTSRLSNAAITSTASTWKNTTLVSVHSPEASTSWSEVSSAKGISTSAGNSALTPFPMTNSTLSQATSLAIDTLTTTYTSDRPAGAITPCKSSSTTSSTCTDSLDHPPYGSSSETLITTDCSTAAACMISSRPYVPTTPGHVSTTCNATSSMVSYSTAHWSNMTETFGVKDIDTSTYGSLTTFKTVTTVRADESVSVWDDYPTPTDRITPSGILPTDPNYPWGNDFPIHRHQNVSDVGIVIGDGGVSKRGDWRLRWENVKDKVKSMWHGQTLETEG